MTPAKRPSRRSFLTASASVVGAAASLAEAAPGRTFGPNDRVRIATIGMGIIGFIDTEAALRVPGVELVAVSDLYEGRRTHAREVHGDRVDAVVDYREVLARQDVDAVLICAPDHWHAAMAIDAMRAGKAVYCEKPMVQAVAEGPEVIRVRGPDQGRVPGRQPVRQLGGVRPAQGDARGRVDRQAPRGGGPVQPQLAAGGLAVHDPHRRLGRDRGLGPLPGLGPQAPVRRRPLLPLAEVLGLRDRRGRRPVRPPAHGHPPRHRVARPDQDLGDGGPPLLGRRPRRVRRDPGAAGLPPDRRPPPRSPWPCRPTSRTAGARPRCSASSAPTA